MNDPELDRAKEPLKRFLMRSRNLTADEKIEAYGMLLDCILEVVRVTNAKNIIAVKEIMTK